MLAKLLAKIKQAAFARQGSVDPAVFDDPVALRTSWEPARGERVSFQTYHLVSAGGPERMEFRPTRAALLFWSAFAVTGAGAVVACALTELGPEFGASDRSVLTLVGVVFMVVGAVLLYAGRTPIVFDKHCGYFWKGRGVPDEIFAKRHPERCVALGQIHALQIVPLRGGDDPTSYELNVVLGDGRRIAVVSHAAQTALREDARVLAEFVDRPLWDAS